MLIAHCVITNLIEANAISYQAYRDIEMRHLQLKGLQLILEGENSNFLPQAVVEFQRDMIRENTVLELAAARERGKKIGIPFALEPELILDGHKHVTQLGLPMHMVAERLNVSHATLARGFHRLGLTERQRMKLF